MTVLTALALAANTLVLSVLDALLFSGLGIPEPDRFGVIGPTREMPGRGDIVFGDAWPNYVRIRGTQRSFAEVAASVQSVASWDDGGEMRAVQASRVTASFFAAAGVAPLLGRTLLEEEEGPSPAAVALVGHALWQIFLGGRADVVGTTLLLNDEPVTVVGVMPPGFELPLPTEVWLPFDLPEAQRHTILGSGPARRPWASRSTCWRRRARSPSPSRWWAWQGTPSTTGRRRPRGSPSTCRTPSTR